MGTKQRQFRAALLNIIVVCMLVLSSANVNSLQAKERGFVGENRSIQETLMEKGVPVNGTSVQANNLQQGCQVGVGEDVPLEVTQAFQGAYERNGGAEVMGVPELLGGEYCMFEWFDGEQSRWRQNFTDMPNWGKSAILWNTSLRRAYVVHGAILGAYSDRQGSDIFPPAIWLGDPTSDQMIATADLVARDGRFGGEPISYFERGFISRYQGTNEFKGYAYHPAICDVNVRIANNGDNQAKFDISATIYRAPGWPTADATSDPLDAYFTAIFPEYEVGRRAKRWAGLTQDPNNKDRFTATITDWPLKLGEDINFYLDAYNRKWQNIRTLPKAVVNQPGWPEWSYWQGPVDSLFAIKLADGVNVQLPNDNQDCKGGNSGGTGPIKVPPIAKAGGNHIGEPFGRKTVNVGDTVVLDGAGSYDPDGGTIISYEWKIIATPPGREHEKGKTFTGIRPAWKKVSSDDLLGWTFELRVTDDEGQTASDRLIITVRDGDKDRDGLIDTYEDSSSYLAEHFDSQKADTDNDGLLDGEEVRYQAYTRPDIYFPQYRIHSAWRDTAKSGQENWCLPILGCAEIDYEPGAEVVPIHINASSTSSNRPLMLYSTAGAQFHGPRRSGAGEQRSEMLPTGRVDVSLTAKDFKFGNGAGNSELDLNFGEMVLNIVPEVYEMGNGTCASKSLVADVATTITFNVVGAYDNQLNKRSEPGFRFRHVEKAELYKSTKGRVVKLNDVGLAIGGGLPGATWGGSISRDGAINLNAGYLNLGLQMDRGSEPELIDLVVTNGGKTASIVLNKQIIEDGWPDCRTNAYALEFPLSGGTSFAANGLDTIEVTLDATVHWKFKDAGEVQADRIKQHSYIRVQAHNYNGGIPAGASSLSTSVRGGSATSEEASTPVAQHSFSAPIVTDPQEQPLAATTWITRPLAIDNIAPVDIDKDGLIDQLGFTTTVTTTSSSPAQLYAELHNESGELVETLISEASLLTGTQELTFVIDSSALSQAATLGQLTLKHAMAVIENEGVVYQAAMDYQTPDSYLPSQFDPKMAIIKAEGFDTVDDRDGDSYFDHLLQTINVNVNTPGRYAFTGSLYAPDGTFITSDTIEHDFGLGSHTLTIPFDGLAIREAGKDGPYQVVVSAYHSSLSSINMVDAEEFTTLVRTAHAFEQRDVSFSGISRDEGIDTDRNNKYNFLAVDLGLSVHKPGIYTVQASLTDPHANLIRSHTKQVSLTSDTQLRLLFDGIAIGENGVNGPYRLGTIDLVESATGRRVAHYENADSTRAYKAADFENGPAATHLAKVENGNLVLMIGPRAAERGIAIDEKNEDFTVRQLDQEATTFAVTAFGMYEEHQFPTGGQVIGDAGDGDDRLSLEPGTGIEGKIFPFSARAVLKGGDGNDHIWSGDGADTLTGGAGNDTIAGGAGSDTISGNANDDIILGGAGNDTLGGNQEDDAISGGPGADTITGDAGNDILNGNVANQTAPGSDPDLADSIIGGAGSDIIGGAEGDDILHGDEITSCETGDSGLPSNEDRINGGAGQDDIFGGAGNDTLLGEEGNDFICGNSGDDVATGNDGSDMLSGGLGSDTLDGGAGQDYLFGDSGNMSRAASPPATAFSETVGANDILHGGDEQDVLYGEGGNDQLLGDAGDDRLSGNAGNDHLAGGDGADLLFGNADNDMLLGEQGADRMFGNTGNDTLQGGADDDYLEGNEETDTLSGDDGQDDLIGGSSAAGTPDDRDVLFGNQGQDVLVGDNASITRSGSINPADGAVVRAVTLLDPGLGGDDTLSGNEHNDQLYGQVGDDLIHGNEGDDYAEGNHGADTIYGGADQDDLIGGTSQRDAFDGSDAIYGGNSAGELSNDFDTITGDNARISRPVTSTGQWLTDALSVDTAGMVRRHITLFDVATTTFTPIQGTSAADILDGESGRDILYGQGGDDTLIGGPGDDYIEGNAGSETIHGSAGNDDIVGGTGRINDDGPTGVNGRVDSADELHGDDGFDILVGDNAILVRKVVNGRWLMNTFNSGIQHEPRILLDRDSPNSSQVSGSDRLFGDVDDDLLYGQGNDDSASGGAGDDYLEGNAGSDTVHGDEGQDDIIGGTMDVDAYDAGDLLYGDGDSDVMLGDNGSISRPLDSSGRWRIDINTGARLRHTVLFNVERIDAPQDARLRGPDTMQGGNGPDQLYGQGANDTLSGGAADDVIEGNHGPDLLHGNEGEDDLIGGSSAGNGVIGSGTDPSNLTDTDDEIFGDDDDDVILGDNGVIQRPTISDGRWQVLRGFGFDLVVRRTTIAQTPEQVGAFGNDSLFGNAGHDDLIGQMGDDYLEGNTGEDALVGDLGSITNRLEDGSRQQVIAPHQPFIDDTIFKKGSLSRLVQLYRFNQGQGADGKDILLGGDGNDSLHGSAGADLIQGDGDTDLQETADEDHLFGGDGNDVLWGGRGHDHVWGGYGNDYLDVKPRPASSDRPADPTNWFTYGMTDNYQGIDYLYGGWGQDALQANIGGPGKTPGDRLFDWVGAYNVYYVCSGAYGEGVITRSHSPSIIQFLQKLAESDGAIATATPNASGFAEVGIVFANEAKENANPVHQDHPGHFTCN